MKYNLSLSPNWKFVIYTFVIVVLLMLAFSKYIETEILTRASQFSLNSDQVCLDYNQAESKFAYSRIISLDRAKRIARVYCIYQKTRYNVALELEYHEVWTVVYTEMLNKKRSFYWQLYI